MSEDYQVVKKKRGRPRKNVIQDVAVEEIEIVKSTEEGEMVKDAVSNSGMFNNVRDNRLKVHEL
jgi:hypothetical protein